MFIMKYGCVEYGIACLYIVDVEEMLKHGWGFVLGDDTYCVLELEQVIVK